MKKLNEKAEKLIVNCIYYELCSEHEYSGAHDNVLLYWTLQERGFASDIAADISNAYINEDLSIEEINKKYNIDVEEVINSADVEKSLLKEAELLKYEFYEYDVDVLNFVVDAGLIDFDTGVIYKWPDIEDCIGAVNKLIKAFREYGLKYYSVKRLYDIIDEFEYIYDVYTDDKDAFSEAIYTYIEQDKIFKLNKKAQDAYLRVTDAYNEDDTYKEFKYDMLLIEDWSDEELIMYTWALLKYKAKKWIDPFDFEVDMVRKYRNKQFGLYDAFKLVCKGGYRPYTDWTD